MKKISMSLIVFVVVISILAFPAGPASMVSAKARCGGFTIGTPNPTCVPTRTLTPTATIAPQPAHVTAVTIISTNPYTLQVDGTTASPCYTIHANTPVVTESTISILVLSYALTSGVCAQVVTPFSINVSVDPVALGLAPGTYDVVINSNFHKPLIVE